MSSTKTPILKSSPCQKDKLSRSESRRPGGNSASPKRKQPKLGASQANAPFKPGSKVSATPPASISKSSKASSGKQGSDRFSVTFSKNISERLDFIREFGHVDPRQFVVDHVESFLNQIWESKEFGEHVTTSYGFTSLQQAIGSAMTANRMDRPGQWFFFKTKDGVFHAESGGRQIAQRVREGAKILATMAGWNFVEVVEK